MQVSTFVSNAMKLGSLALLVAFTKPIEAREPSWGHCVVKGIGDPPEMWCECKLGPASNGVYNCQPSGTPCSELFPEYCTF